MYALLAIYSPWQLANYKTQLWHVEQIDELHTMAL